MPKIHGKMRKASREYRARLQEDLTNSHSRNRGKGRTIKRKPVAKRTDRPLIRRLIKVAMSITDPARAHRQDIWPGMAIDRATGRVEWRGQPLTRLVTFADIVPRNLKLIAVVGSGPSLARQDPTHLPPGSAILLNGAAILADRIAPLAVMVEDERFVFRHMAMLAALPRDLPLMLSPAALRAMAERDADVLRHRKIALIDNLAKPVNGPRRVLSGSAFDAMLARAPDGAALSVDPDTGIAIFGTVALSAVQVALAAAPQRILLAGIDLNNAHTTPRFYEQAGHAAPSGIVAGLDRVLRGFALARDRALAQGVAMTCASPVSALLDLGFPHDDLLNSYPRD